MIIINSFELFEARGPNFKKNVTINGFINTNVYPLMCRLLKIECHPNNGSIDSFQHVLNSAQKTVQVNLINQVTLMMLILNLIFD
jgi:hypothetical protein